MRMFQMISWLFWMSCKAELSELYPPWYYKRIMIIPGVIPMAIQGYLS